MPSDLEALAELAEEDPELAGEFEEQIARGAVTAWTSLRRSVCSRAATTPATPS